MSKYVEIYQAKTGKGKGRWRARVKARNGRVLMVSSEGYVRRRDLVQGLQLTSALLRHCR